MPANLGLAEHARNISFFLPDEKRRRSFDQTIQSLGKHFGDPSSLLTTRYQYLKLIQQDAKNLITDAGIVDL